MFRHSSVCLCDNVVIFAVESCNRHHWGVAPETIKISMAEKKNATAKVAVKTAEKKASAKTAAKPAEKKVAVKTTQKTTAGSKSALYINAESVGFRAGDVYQALASAGQSLTVMEIAKAASISKEEALLGIGWLFKEGKVVGENVADIRLA